MEIKESQVELLILNFLNYRKGFRVYKIKNIGVYDSKKNVFRKPVHPYTPKGMSDLAGNYNGRSLYIEVKTPKEYKYLMKHYEEIKAFCGVCKKKNHLQNQIKFIEDNLKDGCIAFFSDGIETTVRELAKFGVSDKPF